MRPLCFVLMPFGVKAGADCRQVDFDDLYRTVIAPAVEDADLDVIRADEERDGGIIHKPMFERLVLCPFAVADLTLANANVFYELGVRHAVRPYTTVLLFEEGGQRLPFDVAPLRAIPYRVRPGGEVDDPAALHAAIVERLDAAQDPSTDSPLYQLLDGFVAPDIARLKTDVFRERVRYSESVKARLADARAAPGPAVAVAAVHDSLRPINNREAGVAVDLLLSYREAGDHAAMITLVGEMAPPVASSVLVREQLAFALNREGRGFEAERELLAVYTRHGPSSETLGLLGRVYKDRWEQARQEGSAAAPALLQKAIDAYRRGFEADWHDAYPGVNAATLLECQGPGQSAIAELVPVVRYAAGRRIATAGGDFWDHATLLELAVLSRDDVEAAVRLGAALVEGPAPWMRETAAGNLGLIAEAREGAGEDTGPLRALIAELCR
jgi:hypothetical protein